MFRSPWRRGRDLLIASRTWARGVKRDVLTLWFVRAHPDLYDTSDPRAPLRIEHGAIRIDSLFDTGFAHQADPDPATLQPLGAAAALV